MLFFQNLVDETQMPKPQKYTDTFILTKKLFIVGLRGLQNISIPVERPCIHKKHLDEFQVQPFWTIFKIGCFKCPTNKRFLTKVLYSYHPI